MLKHPHKIKRLVIKGVNRAIGDTVMAVPLLKKIRSVFSNAHITLVCPSFAIELLQNNPEIDEFVPCDLDLLSKIRTVWHCLKRQYQVGICIQRSFEAAFMFRLGMVRYLIGYNCDYRGWLLNERIAETDHVLLNLHQVDYYLHILHHYRAATPPRLQLHLSAEQKQLHPGTTAKPLIAINPGAEQGSAKRWLPERFRETGERLQTQLKAQVVVFGSPKEIPICRQATPAGGLNLAGRTSLSELVAYIAKCRLFITNDTGSMHLAAALGVPTVVIIGPTDPARTGPYQIPARLVKKQSCPEQPCIIEPECLPGHHQCMRAVTAAMVVEAALNLYQQVYSK
jgi:heptosyltransferase-2